MEILFFLVFPKKKSCYFDVWMNNCRKTPENSLKNIEIEEFPSFHFTY